MNFRQAVTHIFKYEGGLVDHPKDPGGITKFGISLRAYPDLGADGIRRLTKKDASGIYKRDYWDTMYCDDLPNELRLMAFDCAVNQGVNYARKALQTSLSVVADGVIGPKTLAAAKSVDPERAVHKFAMNRFLRYMRNRNWRTFGEGWMSRLLSVTMHTYK
jgi:lysozyme family protein